MGRRPPSGSEPARRSARPLIITRPHVGAKAGVASRWCSWDRCSVSRRAMPNVRGGDVADSNVTIIPRLAGGSVATGAPATVDEQNQAEITGFGDRENR